MSCTLCDQPAKTRGWCRLHYQRWRKYGDPTRERPSIADRVASRTVVSGGCLLWTGAHHAEGYGVIRVEGVLRRVTRVVWEAAHGPIPKGLAVLHACDTPACVAVDHLMLGTQRANVKDALSKGRRPQNRAA